MWVHIQLAHLNIAVNVLKMKIKTSTICESFALRKLGSIPVPPQSPACTTITETGASQGYPGQK